MANSNIMFNQNIKLKHHLKHHIIPSSLQAKIFLFFALLSVFIHYYRYKNNKIVLSKIILYYLVYSQIQCNIKGNCHFNAWLLIILPIMLIIIYLLHGNKYFINTEKKLIKLYKKLHTFELIEKLEVYYIVIIILLICLFHLYFILKQN